MIEVKGLVKTFTDGKRHAGSCRQRSVLYGGGRTVLHVTGSIGVR